MLFKKTTLLLSVIIASSTTIGSFAKENNIVRVAGSERYETNIMTSKYSFDKADTVILASGDKFPDALSGGPFAFALDAPLLLSKVNELPKNILDELKRLSPKKIIILGGEDSISSKVETKLKSDYKVTRIKGADRYATSLEIAKEFKNLGWNNGYVIANGNIFADALSSANVAAKNKMSIILTNGKTMPSEHDKIIDVKNTKNIMVGGEDSLKIQDLMGSRVGGTDRYKTAQMLAEKYFNGVKSIILADGRNFPDALTAINIYKKENSPLLLNKNNDISTDLVQKINSNPVNKAIIIGGENSVSNSDFDRIKALIEKNANTPVKPGNSSGSNNSSNPSKPVEEENTISKVILSPKTGELNASKKNDEFDVIGSASYKYRPELRKWAKNISSSKDKKVILNGKELIEETRSEHLLKGDSYYIKLSVMDDKQGEISIYLPKLKEGDIVEFKSFGTEDGKYIYDPSKTKEEGNLIKQNVKLNVLPAFEYEYNKFVENNKEVINKKIDEIKVEDKEKIEKALNDQNKLSDDAKDISGRVLKDLNDKMKKIVELENIGKDKSAPKSEDFSKSTNAITMKVESRFNKEDPKVTWGEKILGKEDVEIMLNGSKLTEASSKYIIGEGQYYCSFQNSFELKFKEIKTGDKIEVNILGFEKFTYIVK